MGFEGVVAVALDAVLLMADGDEETSFSGDDCEGLSVIEALEVDET